MTESDQLLISGRLVGWMSALAMQAAWPLDERASGGFGRTGRLSLPLRFAVARVRERARVGRTGRVVTTAMHPFRLNQQ